MAYRSAPLYEDIIWRTHLQPQDAGLAQAVRATIAKHREHLLEVLSAWMNPLRLTP
ncbi:ferric iron reductase protein [Escherichia coli]|uniref:Ferric iron reductase protein n=1 Tax=Escherichia coli TaxID=562 RepID=A0A377AQ64_ECOLX|nr:ferric iron reductase protein [Escherichia coli]